jgi:twitching motility protein PilI
MAIEPKLSLRDFQTQLADRLKNASRQTSAASKLGFIAGGRYWLIDLQQINEVVTVGGLTPVPWSKPWFVGVASVRGAIHGITDLAAFFDLAPRLEADDCRLLLVHPRYGLNAALRIEQPLGLRSVASMKPIHAPLPGMAAVTGGWLDQDGIEWIGLDIERLVADPEFLQAGAQASVNQI